jgi:very-short-patch-repair endonuclease
VVKNQGETIKWAPILPEKIIGNTIADLYCPKARLVIEIDGGQHYSAEGKEKDRLRDENMARAGITVFRFSDREVLENLESVLEKLWTGL